MNGIILAAGKADRLGKIAKNVQKCLISFDGKVAIDWLIEKLPPMKNIFVCISPDFRGEMLENYLSEMHKDLNFHFVVQPEPIGTANAVLLCLQHCKDESVLISWSDILPKDKIILPQKSTIYTTNDFSCRYRFDSGNIEETEGNIIGLFYLTNPNKLIKHLEKNQDKDFVDVLKLSGEPLIDAPIQCYDFGSIETLNDTKSEFSTSAYAKIVASGNKAVKLYSSSAVDLYEKESIWYAYAPASVKRFIPKIYCTSPCKLEMEFIDAKQPVFDTIDEMKDFLSNVVYILDEYFHSNKYPCHIESLFQEYIYSPINRCNSIKVVPHLTEEEISINGTSVKNPVNVLNDIDAAKSILDTLKPEHFTFIHGDPTLQNMLQKGGKIWFIDPKAKFGDIWLYGDPKYDFAKIYYSLVGNYDGFNRGEYDLSVDGNNFIYSIGKHKFSELGDWYLNYLEKYGIDSTAVRIVHALIWIRAVDYVFPKSIEQAIVAFLNGAVLLNEVRSD
jgi:molybdopterin-guanine dinucleotide biosynthesis protein A/thiamine kinase-like enzyme